MRSKPKTGRLHGKFDTALLALDLALVAGVALLLLGFDRGLRKQAETAALQDNKFLTTEWRLMRELKERTDQELRDKDNEIDSLRLQYLRLKGSGSSADLLAEIEAAMARAESERAAILSARSDSEAGTPPVAPSSPAPSPAPTGPSQASGVAAESPAGNGAVYKDAGTIPDNALAELLCRRIVGLEEALRGSQAGSAAIERELEALRLDVEQQDALRPSAAETPGAPAAAPPVPAGAAPLRDEDAVAAILAALQSERAVLADPETVLSLSDLKTRSIMRAIVRSPAIRSQYPDLFEALDRYLELVEKEGYLRGKQEALDEIQGMIDRSFMAGTK